MNPLRELQRLLSPASSASYGRVVSTDVATVVVATSRGTVVATRKDATDYRPGDRAFLNGRTLAGKGTDETVVPVFFV